MDNISIIAAIGKNNELGKNNDLIWDLPKDRNFFKEQTMNKPIIMGMNTYNSLPKLLPGRKHIVLSNSEVILPEEIIIYHSLNDLLSFIESYKEEVMIIGGASLYKQFLTYAKKLILTEIDQEDKEADVYFPKFSKEKWHQEFISANKENNISYKHYIYTRK